MQSIYFERWIGRQVFGYLTSKVDFQLSWHFHIQESFGCDMTFLLVSKLRSIEKQCCRKSKIKKNIGISIKSTSLVQCSNQRPLQDSCISSACYYPQLCGKQSCNLIQVIAFGTARVMCVHCSSVLPVCTVPVDSAEIVERAHWMLS